MRAISQSWLGGIVAACLPLLAGCGDSEQTPTGSVSGKVTLDEKPLAGVLVTFFEEEHAYSASGETGSDGGYTLTYAGGSQIPVGSYKVQVTPKVESALPPAAGGTPPEAEQDSPIPGKYRKFDTSGLSAEVKSEPTTVDLELK